MQDVTDLAFWRLISSYGGADIYFTEYFRVHADSRLEKWIVESITRNPTARPIVAQMIGNDIPSLVRTARELQQLPVAAIDLNLGCPAPVVYKKCAGGGLLREPRRVDAILGSLREAIATRFTVKTRLGFDDPGRFDDFLAIFARHSLDLLTVHGRTVAEMYRSEVRYDYIQRAAAVVPCPVLANGNIDSAPGAAKVLQSTGARGVMLGRGAIRNPWLFCQIRQHLAGEPVHFPTGRQVLQYVGQLYEAVCNPNVRETQQVQKMKKYLNFLGAGVERSADFLYRMRRAGTRAELFAICAEHFDHDNPLDLVPERESAQAPSLSPA